MNPVVQRILAEGTPYIRDYTPEGEKKCMFYRDLKDRLNKAWRCLHAMTVKYCYTLAPFLFVDLMRDSDISFIKETDELGFDCEKEAVPRLKYINHFKNHWRNNLRKKTTEELPDDAHSADKSSDGEDVYRQEDLKNALLRRPPVPRALIVLHYLEDIADKEFLAIIQGRGDEFDNLCFALSEYKMCDTLLFSTEEDMMALRDQSRGLSRFSTEAAIRVNRHEHMIHLRINMSRADAINQ